jgi:hypothetical protein
MSFILPMLRIRLRDVALDSILSNTQRKARRKEGKKGGNKGGERREGNGIKGKIRLNTLGLQDGGLATKFNVKK